MNLANLLGTIVCLDENTTNKSCMDISRFMVRVKDTFILPEVVTTVIEGKDFVLALRKDSFGPLRIYNQNKGAEVSNTYKSLSSNFEDSWRKFDMEEGGEKENNERNGLFDGQSYSASDQEAGGITQRIVDNIKSQKAGEQKEWSFDGEVEKAKKKGRAVECGEDRWCLSRGDSSQGEKAFLDGSDGSFVQGVAP